MINEWLLEVVMGACGFRKCPKCGSTKVDAVRIRRSPGQIDGFDGHAYMCRECRFRWGKPIAPVV